MRKKPIKACIKLRGCSARNFPTELFFHDSLSVWICFVRNLVSQSRKFACKCNRQMDKLNNCLTRWVARMVEMSHFTQWLFTLASVAYSKSISYIFLPFFMIFICSRRNPYKLIATGDVICQQCISILNQLFIGFSLNKTQLTCIGFCSELAQISVFKYDTKTLTHLKIPRDAK